MARFSSTSSRAGPGWASFLIPVKRLCADKERNLFRTEKGRQHDEQVELLLVILARIPATWWIVILLSFPKKEEKIYTAFAFWFLKFFLQCVADRRLRHSTFSRRPSPARRPPVARPAHLQPKPFVLALSPLQSVAGYRPALTHDPTPATRKTIIRHCILPLIRKETKSCPIQIL